MALASGDLLESVILHDNSVTLNLKSKYTNKAHYSSISASLRKLYTSNYGSELFKAKFKCPTTSIHSPVLKLRKGHGFKDAKEVQAFLQSCASKRKRQVSGKDPQASLEKAPPVIENLSTITAEAALHQTPNSHHSISSHNLLFGNGTLIPPSVHSSPIASPMPSYQVSSLQTHFSFFEERIKQLEAELMEKNAELELKTLEVDLLMYDLNVLKRKLPPEFANTTMNDEEVTHTAKRFRKE